MAALLRLNRFLAQAGVGSRRRCDELIRSGRVQVNGVSTSELGTKVDPARDAVSLDGTLLKPPRRQWTLALNKPVDVLVAAKDARGRRTVMDLLQGAPGRVFPVGRLDYRSDGLLLLTSDGDLAFRLAHPRFKVAKVYQVDVASRVSGDVVEALRRGVLLEDGPTRPALVRVVRERRTGTSLEIELREGRKRQIRRMLALFGLEVQRLTRIRFGPVALGRLAPGTWRALSDEEVRALREAASLSSAGADGAADVDGAEGAP
jgi:23S rRNA pseudouridine2605 synthase